MADDYDIDWDDDFLDGDMSFDDDFDNMDPFKGKSIISSFATGVFQGMFDGTIGTTSGRLKTLKTVLPSTFSNLIDKQSFISYRIEELAREFREENSGTAKSLQNIAAGLSERLRGKADWIADKLDGFTEKDFSSWEPSSFSTDTKQPEITDSDVNSLISRSMEQQSGILTTVGDNINNMAAAVGTRISSAIGVSNRQLVNIEGSIKELLDYNRNYSAKFDQAKVSIMAKTYLLNAQYYKFQETATHRSIQELQKIVKGIMMPEYEKTNLATQAKSRIRDWGLDVIGRRFGGLSDVFRNSLGSDALKGKYKDFGDLASSVEMMMDMSSGMPMSKGMIANMLGSFVGDKFVDKIPALFKQGFGKKQIDKLRAMNPELAARFDKGYAKLGDVGNKLSYLSTSGEGIVNAFGSQWEALEENYYSSYDDYKEDMIARGKKPLGKAAWTLQNPVSNAGKSLINNFMREVTANSGTQYRVKRRTAKELSETVPWRRINDITLTSVIPGYMSKMTHYLAMIATGDKNVKEVDYNYMRGQFVSKNENQVLIRSQLFQHGDMRSLASSTQNYVGMIDNENLLSPEAKRALALNIAKDVDKDKSFNPYYYVNGVEGGNEKVNKEISSLMKRKFGLTDDHINDFNNMTGNQKMKASITMGNREGQELLNRMGAEAADLRQRIPNLSETISILRQTGNEQLLRDLGVIYTEKGVDHINIELFWERLGKYMENPDNPELMGDLESMGKTNTDAFPGAKKGRQRGRPRKNRNDIRLSDLEDDYPTKPGMGEKTFASINETLAKLNVNIEKLSGIDKLKFNTEGFNFDLGKIPDDISAIKTSNDEILNRHDRLYMLVEQMTDVLRKTNVDVLDRSLDEIKRTTKETNKDKDSLFDKGLGKLGGIIPNSFKRLSKLSPYIQTGLLAGLVPLAFGSWQGAAGVAAGGVAGYALWKKYKERSSGASNEPSDEEDIIDENQETVLSARTLTLGGYVDLATRKVIKTWKDIKGPIIDTIRGGVINLDKLRQKIFSPEGKEVVLKGLQKLKDGANVAKDNIGKLWSFLDLGGRFQSAKDFVKKEYYQQDIYVKGDKTPTLTKKGFQNGEYFKNVNGYATLIEGWNEIDGPVIDKDQNILISQEDIDEKGLVTSSGFNIRKLGAFTKTMGSVLGKKIKDYSKIAGEKAGDLGTKAKDAWNNSSLFGNKDTELLNKIYCTLLRKFGYTDSGIGAMVNENGEIVSYQPTPTVDPTGVTSEKDIDDVLGDGLATEQDGVPGVGGKYGKGKLRLNSLEYKTKEAKDKKVEATQDALIGMADAVKDLAGGGEEKGESKGFLGKLLSGMGLAGGMLMKFLKNPFSTMGGFFVSELMKAPGRFIKIGSLLFKGVLGIGSPIYKLVKWGVMSICGGLTRLLFKREGGGLAGGIGGKKGKISLNPKRMLLTAGLAYAGYKGVEYMTGGDEDPSKVLGTDSSVDVDPYAELNSAVDYADDSTAPIKNEVPQGDALDYLSLLGPHAYLLDQGLNVAGSLANDYNNIFGGGYEQMTNRALMLNAGTFDDSELKKRYKEGKLSEADILNLKQLANTETGFFDAILGRDNYTIRTNARQFLLSEGIGFKMKDRQRVLRFIQYGIRDPKGSLAERVRALEEMLNPYVDVAQGKGFFKNNAQVSAALDRFANMGSSYKDKNNIATWFMVRFKPIFLTYHAVARSVGYNNLDTFDFSDEPKVLKVLNKTSMALAMFDPFPYKADGRIDERETLMGEDETKEAVANKLKEITSEFKDMGVNEEGIPLDIKLNLETQDEVYKKATEGEQSTWEWMVDSNGRRAETKLAEKYVVPKSVSEIDISDLHKDSSTAMDPFTLLRLGVYGLNPQIPWQVDALLKLERYCEDFIEIHGDTPRFVGKTGDIYKTFMPTFRIDGKNKNGQVWNLWFRDRFLPVLMGYIRLCVKLKRGKPKAIWTQLSNTNKYDIANFLTNLTVSVEDKTISIWEVEESPFPYTKSIPYEDIIKKYLKYLESLSSEETIKQPELVDKDRLNKSGEISDIDKEERDRRTREAVERINKRNISVENVAASGAYGLTPGNGVTVLENGRVDMPDNFDYTGGDAPPPIPKTATFEEGMQAMFNSFAKFGITDALEQAIILGNVMNETGGFKTTIENLNYSKSGLMKTWSRFRNNPEMAEALAKAGPVAIANNVYGGRMGNVNPGDGYKFRGRGPIQITGYDNYAAAGKLLGVDLIKDPDWVLRSIQNGADAAMAYWINNPILGQLSRKGDAAAVRTKVNGGQIGHGNAMKLTKDMLIRLKRGEFKKFEEGATKERTETSSSVINNQSESTQNVSNSSVTNNNVNTTNNTNYGGQASQNGSQSSFGGSQNYGGYNTPHNFETSTNEISKAAGTKTADYKGLKIKPYYKEGKLEPVGGGPVHPGLIVLGKAIQSQVSGFNQFTALNDLYHQAKSNTSFHKQGLALDFTINGGSVQEAIKVVMEIMSKGGLGEGGVKKAHYYGNDNYLIIDEYNTKTKNTTAGHIHVNFASNQIADKFLKAYGAGVTDPNKTIVDTASEFNNTGVGDTPNYTPDLATKETPVNIPTANETPVVNNASNQRSSNVDYNAINPTANGVNNVNVNNTNNQNVSPTVKLPDGVMQVEDKTVAESVKSLAESIGSLSSALGRIVTPPASGNKRVNMS